MVSVNSQPVLGLPGKDSLEYTREDLPTVAGTDAVQEPWTV